jgi:hypothetical protein
MCYPRFRTPTGSKACIEHNLVDPNADLSGSTVVSGNMLNSALVASRNSASRILVLFVDKMVRAHCLSQSSSNNQFNVPIKTLTYGAYGLDAEFSIVRTHRYNKKYVLSN